jgi:hypothetical protein
MSIYTYKRTYFLVFLKIKNSNYINYKYKVYYKYKGYKGSRINL